MIFLTFSFKGRRVWLHPELLAGFLTNGSQWPCTWSAMIWKGTPFGTPNPPPHKSMQVRTKHHFMKNHWLWIWEIAVALLTASYTCAVFGCPINKVNTLVGLFFSFNHSFIEIESRYWQFTHFKCRIQGVFFLKHIHRALQQSPSSILEHFQHPKRNPIPTGSHSPFFLNSGP